VSALTKPVLAADEGGAASRANLRAAPVPAVTALSVNEFRSYERAELKPARRLIVLTGANGAGKTNLLEALSLLSPGRGLRRARLDDIQRLLPVTEAAGERADRGWAVAASITTSMGPIEVGTGRLAEPAEISSRQTGRRLVRIDGVTQRNQASLGERLAVAWLTPQMDRLFLEGAAGRRRLLDRMVFGFDADHARRLTAYEQAMRERLRLLAEPRTDSAWLAALEDGMASEGAQVALARVRLVGALAEAVAQGVGPFPAAELALAGALETLAGERGDAERVAAEFRQLLAGSRRADQAAGSTLHGPHRTDLLVRHRAKSMPAAFCSTGEQKALLISLHLAHARLVRNLRGAPPLLLLDEIAAHLDAERRADLFEEIAELGGQAWLTGTEPSLFAALGGQADFFAVAEGRVTRV
jgi:DNA replication and repair protein RecF